MGPLRRGPSARPGVAERSALARGRLAGRLRGRGAAGAAQPLPSGSLKNTKSPHGKCWTSDTSTPRPSSSARAAATSDTTTCKPSTEPGGFVESPTPNAIEQSDPRGVICTNRRSVADVVVVVEDEPDLVDVEGDRPVDVRHGHAHQLELPVHRHSSRGACTRRMLARYRQPCRLAVDIDRVAWIGDRRLLALMVAVIASAAAPATAVAQTGSEPRCSTRSHECPPPPRRSCHAPISYVDYRAVEAARPGALVPTSLAELLERSRRPETPPPTCWFAASMGIVERPERPPRGTLQWRAVLARDRSASTSPTSTGRSRSGRRPRTGPSWSDSFDPSRSTPPTRLAATRARRAGRPMRSCVQRGGLRHRARDGPREHRPEHPVRWSARAAASRSPSRPRDVLSSADVGTIDAMLAAADGSRAVAGRPDGVPSRRERSRRTT